MNQFYCTVCPKQCFLTVKQDSNGIEVTGNKCPRGEQFARLEITSKLRVLTTTVLCNKNGKLVLLPVRSVKAIPLEYHKDIIKQLRKKKVDLPVKMKDVILFNAMNTGVDIVACSNMNE